MNQTTLVQCGCAVFVASMVLAVKMLRSRARDRLKTRDPDGASPQLQQKKSQWVAEQGILKQRMVEQDSAKCFEGVTTAGCFPNLKYVGGVDISFLKADPTRAVACVAILDFPNLSVLAVRFKEVVMTEPYIAGFLAFRECAGLQKLLQEVKTEFPNIFPQVILVDGNGKLHYRGFGLASHLGVVCDIPTIGIGKNLLCFDGLERHIEMPKFDVQRQARLARSGSEADGPVIHPLVGNSGVTWGNAMAFSTKIQKPVFVSVGHRVSLETATQLAAGCCKYRLPEPVRQADLLSREYVRNNLS